MSGTSDGALHRVQKIREMLLEVSEHAKADATKTENQKAQALFETTAEVLLGLVVAFEHFEQGAEPAWKQASARART